MTGSARSAGTLAQGGTLTMLYRAGAVAALATVAITLFQIVAGVLWPPPDFAPTTAAATHILEMAQTAPLLTFVKLDGLMLIDYVLLAVVYVALYAALRRAQPSLMTLGTVFALMAITLYFAVNPAATALVLAGQYVVDGSATGVVAAMQAVLAGFQGTGFLVHYLVMGVAGILVGLAMLRSDVFSRGTAIAGILQGAMMLVPVTFGTVGLLFALGSLIPFIVWFVLVGKRLLRLAGESASG
ncbi:MAG: hypothetical protein WBJ62_05970 [Coriobacteriia bacterium]